MSDVLTQVREKWVDPRVTANGEPRATVTLHALETLWFNSGALGNSPCGDCYIESSPTNDSLVYLTLSDVASVLDEVADADYPVNEIGFTGGEPFMNPEFGAMLGLALERGFRVLVLTNAMQPMQRPRVKQQLKDLQARYGGRLVLRVSLDHYTEDLHDRERGRGSWASTIKGMRWLSEEGFTIHVAGRTCWGEREEDARLEFGVLFRRLGLSIDPEDQEALVLFPEMDETADVPEITTACWDLLGVDPRSMMCASSRMVVRRKGADAPTMVACTLLPYEDAFDLGPTLKGAHRPVALNHPHCAKFCVLGGGSCSA